MFNKKGSTLIESLLAFEIYISVLVIFISLFLQVFQQENFIRKQYQSILEKEEKVLFEDDYTHIIETVLH